MSGMKSDLLKVISVILLLCMLMAACGAGGDSGETEEPPVGWDYFETFNPIGETYGSMGEKYDELEESGVFDGGVVLQADGMDLFFGFPKYSADELEKDDPCTSVYGTLETLFGITESYASDDLEEILSVKWQEDYDGTYFAKTTHEGKDYYIKLNVENINELYKPATSAAIFSGDE